MVRLRLDNIHTLSAGCWLGILTLRTLVITYKNMRHLWHSLKDHLPLLPKRQEIVRVVMITTSFLTWGFRTVTLLSVHANVPFFTVTSNCISCLLGCSCRHTAAQDGKDIMKQNPFFCPSTLQRLEGIMRLFLFFFFTSFRATLTFTLTSFSRNVIGRKAKIVLLLKTTVCFHIIFVLTARPLCFLKKHEVQMVTSI